MESDIEKSNKKSDELEKDSPPKLKQNEQVQEEPGVNDAEILEKSNVEDESKKDNTAITIRESDVESIDEPPSMLKSPLTRMKYDWEHSENGAKFCGRVFCSSLASLSRSSFNNRFPILSAAELIVGSIYFHDCPAEPRIPLYLVVVGVLGVFLPLIPICYKYLPKSLQDGIQTRIHIIHRIEAILRIFSFIWFILGCIWVYNAYRPNYINTRAVADKAQSSQSKVQGLVFIRGPSHALAKKLFNNSKGWLMFRCELQLSGESETSHPSVINIDYGLLVLFYSHLCVSLKKSLLCCQSILDDCVEENGSVSSLEKVGILYNMNMLMPVIMALTMAFSSYYISTNAAHVHEEDKVVRNKVHLVINKMATHREMKDLRKVLKNTLNYNGVAMKLTAWNVFELDNTFIFTASGGILTYSLLVMQLGNPT